VKARNVVLALLVVALLATGGLAWRQHLEVQRLRDAALASSDGDDLRRKVADLQRANRELQDQLAASKAGARDDGDESADMTERPAPGGNRRDGGPRFNRGQQFAAVRELMNKPEVQAIVAKAEKAAVDARYAALFRNLNLTPEQADRLKALIVERQNTVQDVAAAAREQGINPRSDPDAFRKMVADAQKTVDDSIKTVIGDQGLSQLNNYEQTMPQRNLVSTFQQRLAVGDTPLSATQAEALVQILAATAPASTGGNQGFGGPRADFGGMGGRIGAVVGGFGGGGGGGGVVGPGSVPITDTAISRASAVLSTSQLNALQQLQEQQQTAQQLQQMYRSALQPANGTGAASQGGATGRRRGGG
jgi:hypothetical protein